MKEKQKIILIRGIPGAGKSTYAKFLKEKYKKYDFSIFEADDFFMVGEKYEYNPSKIKDAHEYCYKRAMDSKGKNIIISNTFTKVWEMKKYLALANEYDADCIVFRIMGHHKNVHDVPEEVINRMERNFEDFEGEHIITTL